jgi:hypothetical protein
MTDQMETEHFSVKFPNVNKKNTLDKVGSFCVGKMNYARNVCGCHALTIESPLFSMVFMSEHD